MLRRGVLCDWGGKGRPIEKVNGLRTSRDWGHGRELTNRAGEVKPRRPGRPSRDESQQGAPGRTEPRTRRSRARRVIKGVDQRSYLKSPMRRLRS